MKRVTNKKIDSLLLKIIVCPLTKEPLVLDPIKNELISKKAKLSYPIVEGIPVLIRDNAKKLK